jgi:prophage regulatory protein
MMSGAILAADPKKPWNMAALPAELNRHRIIPTPRALELVGVSPAQWRRLRAEGLAPQPVMIGARKQGYRLGSLLDWMEARTKQPAA